MRRATATVICLAATIAATGVAAAGPANGSAGPARVAACPGSIRLGGEAFVFYRTRANCTRARRAVRRLFASRGKRGRPRGFRCESGSRYRRGAYCHTRGNYRVFGFHPFD